MEYEARLRPDILKVFKQWKHIIRNKLGRKTFPLLGVPKGAKKTKLQAYIELCNIHVAAMEALSVVELGRIKDVEVKVSVKLSEGGSNKVLPVRDLLMEYKTEADCWVFQMVSPSGSGTYGATFANTLKREKLAANVVLHPAT